MAPITADTMNALEKRPDSELLVEANTLLRMREKSPPNMGLFFREREAARRVIVVLRWMEERDY